MRKSGAPSQVAKRARTTAAKKKAGKNTPAFSPGYSVASFRGMGFPQRLTMRHRYVERVGLTSTTGSRAIYNFIANGMFDPNSTGTGHQPHYFDNLTAIYDHYTVIGSIIKVQALKTSATEVGGTFGIIQNDDTTVTPGAAVELCEQPSAVWTTIAGNTVTPVSLTSKYSVKKTFGGSILGNDDLQGTSTANPSEVTVFSIFWEAYDQLSTTSLNLLVTIEYVAVWDELRDTAAS